MAISFNVAGSGTTTGVTLTIPAGNNIVIVGVDNGNGTGTGKPTQMKVGIQAMTDASLSATVGGQTMWFFYLVNSTSGSQVIVDGSLSSSYEYAVGVYTSDTHAISVGGSATAGANGNQTFTPSPGPSGNDWLAGDVSTSSGVTSAGTNATKRITGAPSIFDNNATGSTSFSVNTTTNIFGIVVVLSDGTGGASTFHGLPLLGVGK